MKRIATLIATVTACGIAIATARPLDITPYVREEVTITDNVNLAPDGQEDAAIVSSTYGGFEALYESPRFVGEGFLEIAGDIYLGRDNGNNFNGIRARGDGFGTITVVPNRGYVDVSAFWTETLIDPNGTFSLTPVAASDDRVGTGGFTISPSWRQPIGANLEAEARTRHSITGAPSGDLPTEVTNSARLSLGTTRPFGRLGFESFAEYYVTESDQAGDVNDLERASVQGTASFALNQWFSLLARGGYDHVDSAGFTTDVSGPNYGAGFRAEPTPRTYLQVIAGERYEDFNLEVDGRIQLTERVAAGVSFNQDVATSSYSQNNLFTGRLLRARGIFSKPTEAELAATQTQVNRLIDAGLLLPGQTNRAYRSAVLNGFVSAEFNNNRFYVNAFGEERDFDRLQPGDPEIDDVSVTLVGGWTHEFNSRLSGTAEATYRHYRTDDPVRSDTDTYGGSLTADYALTPKIDVFGSLVHTQRSATFSSDEYTENALIVGGTVEFSRPEGRMFEDYYGLTSSPFRLTPDHRFYYDFEGHKKAMSYLKYGIYQGEGFIVITGDVGTGKSTLVSQLFAELDESEIVAAQIGTTHVEADDAVRMIVRAFRIETAGPDKASQLSALEDFLREQYEAGRRVLLVIDEAQNLPAKTLEELRMLSNFNVNGESLFQIFLVGQPQFLRYLSNPDLVQLQQRVIASYRLTPLSPGETRSYIEHRLRLVGWHDMPEITDAAFNAIYRETKGVPRRINTLCNRVLLYGALEELDRLDEHAVAEVIKDLKNEVHAAPQAPENTAMDPDAPRPGEPANARPGPSVSERDKVFDDAPVYPEPDPLYPGEGNDTAIKTASARRPDDTPRADPTPPAPPPDTAPETPVAAREDDVEEGVSSEIVRRIDRIETALLAHDRALRELIETAAGYLSNWQAAEAKLNKSSPPAANADPTPDEEAEAPPLTPDEPEDAEDDQGGTPPPLAFRRGTG